MMRRHLLLLFACVHLAGCAAVSGFPRPVFSERDEEAEMKYYLKAASVEQYDACVDKFACRNAIIDARVRAIDVAFYRFERKLFTQESRASLGTDMLTIALDSVAAVTATRGLAAGAGLLTGGRDAYEKQAMSVSLPLLLQEMVASRREILVRIRQGQMMPANIYSLIDALSDTSEYELAGSIPAAAAQLSANAGSQARVADERLAALRAAAFANAHAQAASAAPVPMPAPMSASPAVAVAPAMVPPVAVAPAMAGPSLPRTAVAAAASATPGSGMIILPAAGPPPPGSARP